MIASADGDGRFLLNQARRCSRSPRPSRSTRPSSRRSSIAAMAVYDKDREGHYNLISALHKSLRGSTRRRRSTISRGC
jgi:putative ATPase